MRKRILCALLALVLAVGLGAAALGDYEQMSASNRCVEFIESMEGFSEKAYTDGTGWYIGYGVACKQGEYPDGISRAEAEKLLRGVLDDCAEAVNAFLQKCGARLGQAQFDALCSMTYNFGGSWLDEANRLPRYISRGIENYSDRQIVNAFAAWCHSGGQVSESLLRRRVAEAKMFLTGDYGGNSADWNWLILDPGEGSVDSDVFCYESGGSYGELPTAAREGYDLAGWKTADGEMLEADRRVVKNQRVTAVWEQPELFEDVSEGSWYAANVTRLARLGVVSGFGDGKFHPAANVTNGQALKLITRAVGYSEKAAPESGHWAENYRKFAVSKKFIGENDMEDLDAPISRDAIADLAAAALYLDTRDASGSPFADSSRGSVVALAKAGLVNGSVENGRQVYKGSSRISRAEISAIVCRIIDYAEGKYIIFSDYFVPIRQDLAANPYDRDLFCTENTRVRYGDMRYDVQYGIDVSYYQKDIDWQAVAADGIDFAIIRVGYRGSNAGTLNEDERFQEYIKGATDAGLDVGLYIFSQAVNAEEAREEARFVLERIGDYEITYPIAFDWEPLNYSGSRSLNFDYSVLTDCALAFCDEIERAGYTPMVYLNPSFAYLRYDISRLMNAEKIIWLAHYTSRSNYLYDFQLWQYGSSGRVSGISGRVDMDIAFVNYGAEKEKT